MLAVGDHLLRVVRLHHVDAEAPGADDSDCILLRPEAANLDCHLEHGEAGGEEPLEEVRTAEYLPASITQ